VWLRGSVVAWVWWVMWVVGGYVVGVWSGWVGGKLRGSKESTDRGRSGGQSGRVFKSHTHFFSIFRNFPP